MFRMKPRDGRHAKARAHRHPHTGRGSQRSDLRPQTWPGGREGGTPCRNEAAAARWLARAGWSAALRHKVQSGACAEAQGHAINCLHA